MSKSEDGGAAACGKVPLTADELSSAGVSANEVLSRVGGSREASLQSFDSGFAEAVGLSGEVPERVQVTVTPIEGVVADDLCGELSLGVVVTVEFGDGMPSWSGEAVLAWSEGGGLLEATLPESTATGSGGLATFLVYSGEGGVLRLHAAGGSSSAEATYAFPMG